ADGREVTLLAHVLDNPTPDNDVPAARELAGQVGGDLEVVVPTDLDSVRETIAGARLLIGSRMHACLNALSVGTPAIPLAYSRKFAPLLDSVRWTTGFDLRTDDPATLPQQIMAAAGEVTAEQARAASAAGRQSLDALQMRVEAMLPLARAQQQRSRHDDHGVSAGEGEQMAHGPAAQHDADRDDAAQHVHRHHGEPEEGEHSGDGHSGSVEDCALGARRGGRPYRAGAFSMDFRPSGACARMDAGRAGGPAVSEETMTEPVPFEVFAEGAFLHGTRAVLEPGDRLLPAPPSTLREEAPPPPGVPSWPRARARPASTWWSRRGSSRTIPT